jgi:hypothetical protein
METSAEYIKRSSKWDRDAGVRTDSQTYDLVLNEFGNNDEPVLSWHLPTYSGILEHPSLKNLSSEKVEYIKGIQLLEFVLKQTIFEIECVNKVTSKLAHDGYEFKLNKQLSLDALKIYTDEGYHAYYTEKVAQQIASHYKIDDSELKLNIKDYYNKITNLVEKFGSKHGDICLLAFVIAGENQIVSDISDQMRGVVHEPIREMFRNHMKDEVFHAHFFREVFKAVWPQLTQYDKERMGLTFCSSMEILGLPRTDVYYFSLSKFGYTPKDISKFIDDIYNTNEWKINRVRDRMTPTIELLRQNNVFSIQNVKKCFEDKQYI